MAFKFDPNTDNIVFISDAKQTALQPNHNDVAVLNHDIDVLV